MSDVSDKVRSMTGYRQSAKSCKINHIVVVMPESNRSDKAQAALNNIFILIDCTGASLNQFGNLKASSYSCPSTSPESATTLLPGQDNLAPSAPTSTAASVVVSCGLRLSEVGLSEIRKPQVAGSIPVAGSSTDAFSLSTN